MAQEKIYTLPRPWLNNPLMKGDEAFNHEGREWMDEPDVVSEEVGSIHKLILRAELGHLCGYVGVRKSHPWYGKSVREAVHGGVTWADKIEYDAFAKDKYWYIGFDAGHHRDLVPSMATFHLKIGSEYRDINYIKNNVETLYQSALKAKAEGNPERINHFREYRKMHKKKLAGRRRN